MQSDTHVWAASNGRVPSQSPHSWRRAAGASIHAKRKEAVNAYIAKVQRGRLASVTLASLPKKERDNTDKFMDTRIAEYENLQRLYNHTETSAGENGAVKHSCVLRPLDVHGVMKKTCSYRWEDVFGGWDGTPLPCFHCEVSLCMLQKELGRSLSQELDQYKTLRTCNRCQELVENAKTGEYGPEYSDGAGRLLPANIAFHEDCYGLFHRHKYIVSKTPDRVFNMQRDFQMSKRVLLSVTGVYDDWNVTKGGDALLMGGRDRKPMMSVVEQKEAHRVYNSRRVE
eukprot:3141811-Rhodomonas_salina.1